MLVFYIPVSLLYVCSMGYLLREYRRSPPQQRKELQTVPFMSAITFNFIVLIFKVQQLINTI